jgi:hypothetical protein
VNDRVSSTRGCYDLAASRCPSPLSRVYYVSADAPLLSPIDHSLLSPICPPIPALIELPLIDLLLLL